MWYQTVNSGNVIILCCGFPLTNNSSPVPNYREGVVWQARFAKYSRAVPMRSKTNSGLLFICIIDVSSLPLRFIGESLSLSCVETLLILCDLFDSRYVEPA